MISSKKWWYTFFICLLFFACKSTDCGCPMANEESSKAAAEKKKIKPEKTWIKISK